MGEIKKEWSPVWFSFETYKGDDDFLLEAIYQLPEPDDEVERLLLTASIPELWRRINQPYTQIREANQMDEPGTVVVNKYAEEFDVNIMRPTIWGNPYKIGEDGTREEVIQKYRERLEGLPHLVELARKKLRGKRLGCCCKPQPCHGDVLVEFVEGKFKTAEGESNAQPKENSPRNPTK